jgi:putative ABC transport system permease protein
MSLALHMAAGLRRLFRRTAVECELDEELATYVEMATERHEAAGLPHAQAVRAARVEAGSLQAAREHVRDVGWESVVDTLRQDLRIAFRTLGRSPMATSVAIVSLALGIGATTALFSVYDSLLLRELPVRDPDRLVLLADNRPHVSWSNVLWEEIARRTDLFEGSFAFDFSYAQFNLTHQGRTRIADGLWVSGRFFDVLGVPAMLGRTLRESDDRRGGGLDGPVAVISHAFWQRQFGGAPDVIGRSLTIERVPFTIVGVTPPGFFGLLVGRAFDVAIPIGVEPMVLGESSMLDERDFTWLHIVGRLRPGQTRQTALAALRGAEPQIRAATRPPDDPLRPSRSNGPFDLRDFATGESAARTSYQKPLTLIMGVATLVLLIACANIANLLLARAAARRHEIGVRRALGASRLRIARLCLIESLVLAGIGATFGLAIARWGSRLLVSELSSVASTFYLPFPFDWRILAFTVTVAVGTAALFGMAPAWQASKVRPAEVLGGSGRTLASDRRQHLGQGLVVFQVALSLVLVVFCALFVRTFAALVTRDAGFDRNRILVATADAQRSGTTRAERLATVDRIRDAVRAVPGVAAVAVSSHTPTNGMLWIVRLIAEDFPGLPEADLRVLVNRVSPGWFATYGTRLVAGRDFNDQDRTAAPTVVIVTEGFARQYLGRTDVLGRTIRIAGDSKARPLEIVGVASDSVYESLRDSMPPAMYQPLASVPLFGISISIRATAGSPGALAHAVETAVKGADSNLAVTIRSLDAQMNATLVRERLVAMLSAFFGGLALLLAGLGLYGVTAYAVGRRRGELGVRLALGATPGSVVGLVLRHVALLVAFGTIVGGLASLWAVRFVQTLLFGLTPRDPLSFVLAALVLAAVGLLAGWLPARQAARIDPATVLRNE